MPPKADQSNKSRFNRWGKRKKRTHLSTKKRRRTLSGNEEDLAELSSINEIHNNLEAATVSNHSQNNLPVNNSIQPSVAATINPNAKIRQKNGSNSKKQKSTSSEVPAQLSDPEKKLPSVPESVSPSTVCTPPAVRRSYMGKVKPARQFELFPGRFIGEGHPCFVIAEIGQNHQGNVNIAKELIRAAKNCGADCVKFQKSNLPLKFTQAVLQRPYYSPHSFGQTYGEHKRFLEFTELQYVELQNYAKEIGILFAASPMDESSVDFLASLKVPFIKIGSGDANNFLLLEKVSRLDIPIFYSTGMQTEETVRKAYDLMRKNNSRVAVLQCTSSYPTPYSEVHLNVISKYQKIFPDAPVGYSGHEYGSAVSLAAVALGANVIERHITLDKTWKGNDHACSLTPSELRALVDGIRQIEVALGNRNKEIQVSERPCIEKLGKTVVAARNLKAGTKLAKEDLAVKVNQPLGWPPQDIDRLLGKKLARDVEYEESIMPDAVRN